MSNDETEIPLKNLKINQKMFQVKKGDSLQMAGDKNIKFYYVQEGLLRGYIIDEKGKEHTYMFAPEKWIIGDSMAISKDTESELFIDALENSKIVSYNPFLIKEQDYLTSEEARIEINRLLKRIGVLQERLLMQMSSSALKRYQHFIKTYPNISERVPLKMIASYIGVTPEVLSTVRKQRATKKNSTYN